MKFISRRAHAILDYSVGVFLIAAPWLLGFAEGGSETYVPVALGMAAILYSLITDYELGLLPWISFRVHLVLDVLHGVLLATSPWLFGFADKIYIPHLILGIMEIAVVVFTRTKRFGI